MQINEITTIITVISILIMTSGTGISSSLVFAQNESEIDFDNLTLTNSSGVPVDTILSNGSGVQRDTSGVELPQQQPQGPLSPSIPSQQQPQGPLSPSIPSQQQPQGPLSPPLFNRVQSTEQCTAMVQSLIQRAQDAIDNGEYGQWRSGVFNEIQQLNMDCPEQMQGQQQ
jgi:hypothetical protein